MDKPLSELIRISNAVGRDTSLVQGVGGNTSVKADDGEYMYIKASGTSLKEMNATRGWRRLNTAAVREIFQDKSLAGMDVSTRELAIVDRLLATCDDGMIGGARPSVESPLHAFLDKCVIHLHALVALSYASAKDGRQRIFDLFAGERFPPLWVPYADPGFSLSRKVFHLVDGYRRQYDRIPSIMFLEKHGLLVTAADAGATLRLAHEVIARCGEQLAQPACGVQQPGPGEVDRVERTIELALSEVTGQPATVRHFADPIVTMFLAREDAEKLLRAPALTPDEMGFVKSPILWLNKCDRKSVAGKLRAAVAKGRQPAGAFLVKDAGLFVAGDARMASIVRDIVVGSLFVRCNAQEMGGINGLNRRQRDFIINWEAESFRIRQAAKSDATA